MQVNLASQAPRPFPAPVSLLPQLIPGLENLATTLLPLSRAVSARDALPNPTLEVIADPRMVLLNLSAVADPCFVFISFFLVCGNT